MMTIKAETAITESGWHVGVMKAFPVSVDRAWDFLISPTGAAQVFGNSGLEFVPGGKLFHESFEAEIKLVKPKSHIRMLWKKHYWPNQSAFQIRVFKSGNGATISMYQEKLLNELQRDEMLEHWTDVLIQIESILNPATQN
jgi:hypothetical protein